MKIEVDITAHLTPAAMGAVFAHMGSDQQAEFLATAFRAMGEYRKKDDGTATMGSWGRETQLAHIRDHFDDYPEAREFIDDLHVMTRDEDKDAFRMVRDIQDKIVAAYSLPNPFLLQEPKCRTATEDLTRREYRAREVAAMIPHSAFRFNVETMHRGDRRVVMDTSTEIEIDIENDDLHLGDRYIAHGYPVGTVIGVDEADTRTVTVLLDDVLPSFTQPVVVLDGGVYVPNSGDVEVTAHDGSKTIIRVDGPTMLPIKALEAKMLPPDLTPRTKVGHLGRFDNHGGRPLVAKNCSECKGTGWYTGLNERSPCSQGCKPQ
jgi:hypothetical protein